MANDFEIRRALATHRAGLLKKHGVHTVGRGFKKTGGEFTEEKAIICTVEKKLPVSKIRDKDLIPKYLGTVVTDVIEGGPMRALHTSRHRPAPGGVSCGHFAITAGTLGGWVQHHTGGVALLSNNHVLANSNDAEIGDIILQPGAHDGGQEGPDDLAWLADFIPIEFYGLPTECPISNAIVGFLNILARGIGRKSRFTAFEGAQTYNKVDAAIATPYNIDDVKDEIMEVGKIQAIAEAELGLDVVKSGRTTGLTKGTITQVDVTSTVQYGAGKMAMFDDQIMIEKEGFSAGGDSGSLIMANGGKIVGLLFAGSDQVTIANRIQNVFTELGLKV